MKGASRVLLGVSVADWIQIFLLLGALGSATIAWRSLLQQRRVAKVEASLALIGRWHHPDLAKHVRDAHALISARRPLAEIGDFEPAFLYPLLFLTELALSVKSELVEEDVLYDYFRPAILHDYPQVVEWVCRYRDVTGSDQRFVDIDFLREKWSQREALEERLRLDQVGRRARRRRVRELRWPTELRRPPCVDVDGPTPAPAPGADDGRTAEVRRTMDPGAHG